MLRVSLAAMRRLTRILAVPQFSLLAYSESGLAEQAEADYERSDIEGLATWIVVGEVHAHCQLEPLGGSGSDQGQFCIKRPLSFNINIEPQYKHFWLDDLLYFRDSCIV